jgi:hypothetical protein
MMHCTPVKDIRPRFRVATAALLGGGLAMVAASGCARQLTITQDDYVNNAMQIDRERRDRTGEPLELDVVCVYPKDLNHQRNDRLKPNSGITSAEWFKRRPVPGDRPDMETANDRFRLPPQQIFLLTNERETYGRRIGACLRGARQDGKTITKKGIEFSAAALHDGRSVIYVFGKFTDKQGQVLAVPPAMFHPPGAYTDRLAIRIGVREGGPNYGQYIEIDSEKCPRKLRESE